MWDVLVGGTSTHIRLHRAANALSELRPGLILPEVKDDKNWHGGFKLGFIDKEEKYAYGYAFNVTSPVFVNRSSIPRSQFSLPKQLADPKFKGKIVMDDPRKHGVGAAIMTVMLATYGEEFVRKVFTQQELVFVRNPRQLVEWLVRGRYPIAVGLRSSMLTYYRKKGVGKDVDRLVEKGSGVWSPATGIVAFFEGGPHPNAAKVFTNWLLTKNGQQAWVNAIMRPASQIQVSLTASLRRGW